MDSIYFYNNKETTAPGSGELHGLKIAIQPNISVAGWPTDAGSNALSNYTALEDATIIQRLRQAGASICGSTCMSEFGFGLHNSKAGELLRHHAADVELVLDLMGESRLAASRIDVYGFKPSYGIVSRFGLIGFIPSMECCGILSGNLENIRNILKAVAGQDGKDYSLPDEKTPDYSPQQIVPRELSIGFITEAINDLPAEQQKKFRSSLDDLKKAGFTMREMSMPEYSLFSLVHKIVGSVEASSYAGRYDSVRYGKRAPGTKNWNEMYLQSRNIAFGLLLKSYLIQGAFFQFERYTSFEDACRIRARLLTDMQRLASQADFLIFPAINNAPSDTSLSLDDTYAEFATTVFANVTGQPALYLPPVPGTAYAGFQLSGPRLSDARLLALGEYLSNIHQGGK